MDATLNLTQIPDSGRAVIRFGDYAHLPFNAPKAYAVTRDLEDQLRAAGKLVAVIERRDSMLIAWRTPCTAAAPLRLRLY